LKLYYYHDLRGIVNKKYPLFQENY
jgi:hypothetical protein